MDDKNISCSNCTNRINSLFSELSRKELNILDSHKRSRSFKKGKTLFNEGDRINDFVCLSSGKVKMTRYSGNGKIHIVGLKKAGDALCFHPMICNQPSSASYVSLEDSSICLIRKKDFMQVLRNNNNFSMGIIKALAEDLSRYNSQIVSMTQKYMRARLADALIKVRDIYGTNTQTGFLDVDLKRSDLAGLSNMTVANAIRILSDFKREKLVRVNRRKIEILDMHELKVISLSNMRLVPEHQVSH